MKVIVLISYITLVSMSCLNEWRSTRGQSSIHEGSILWQPMRDQSFIPHISHDLQPLSDWQIWHFCPSSNNWESLKSAYFKVRQINPGPLVACWWSDRVEVFSSEHTRTPYTVLNHWWPSNMHNMYIFEESSFEFRPIHIFKQVSITVSPQICICYIWKHNPNCVHDPPNCQTKTSPELHIKSTCFISDMKDLF